MNVPLERYVPDLLWREQRVILEFDSYRHHSQTGSFRRTWTRHEHFRGLGYEVLHVIWSDLSGHPDRVIVRLAVALARAGWAPD